ncbi:O-antigen polymerase [Janthinobacterium sp. MDB2-8]|uniref:O-antigen polymerase n=1 Tax=Janthinobacterium sp. MDB2-8 TaxID=1259338 RepID=UPI003F25042C
MNIISVLIFISSSLLLVGTYVIWFSRYNIPTHFILGTVFVGYLVPLFFTDMLSEFSPEIVSLYAYILTVGAFFYVAGLLYGFNYIVLDKLIKKPVFMLAPLDQFLRYRYRALIFITVIALVAMALSWMYIGTVPMFAADPFTAKFFRGPYRDAYMRVAVPYRLSQSILITVFPIMVAVWFLTRRKILMLLILLIMIFFSLALTRGLVFMGIFTLIALFSTKKRIYLFWFILSYIMVFSIGSAIYFLAGLLFGSDAYSATNTASAGVWVIIAAGSPDIPDQLNLLTAFEKHGVYTLGRTFVGGLVPGQYYWNPSAWVLYILNDSGDISDLASGGFRIPVAMWGYFSFGWPGVVIVSAISGVIMGASTRYIKQFISYKKVLTSILALSFYTIILGFFAGFYVMSMYALPAALLLIGLLYKFQFGSRSR